MSIRRLKQIEEPSKIKTVTLTLDALAELMVISRAKAMKVDERSLQDYIKASKHEFTPLVNYVYEHQKTTPEIFTG